MLRVETCSKCAGVDGLWLWVGVAGAFVCATGQSKPRHNAGPWVAPVLVAYAVGAGLAVAKQLTGNK